MKRLLFAPLLLVASSACAFEWDDGRGVLPYKTTTTRHYQAATDLEHMRRFRGPGGDTTPHAGRRADSLNAVSPAAPVSGQILRPSRSRAPAPSDEPLFPFW